MGIPKFFRWMSERYPMCSQLITENRIPEFDNLYLDMNGIIHNCSHNNNESAHFRITEEQIWIGIFNYVDHLFAKIKPKKTFFLAIDGVAPRAKMNQQRSRRFRTAKDAEDTRKRALSKGEELPEEDPFDSNCITPGTAFMKKLTLQLRYFISKKVSEDALWRDVEIILSGPEVPGEGEHKIMEFIRLSKAQEGYNPNTRHCLYGLDADLVMLGLLSHDPHFALLREEVTFGGKKSRGKSVSLESQNFYLMHLSLLREYLDMEFKSLEKTLTFEYNLERILDDFILLALFVGNDFLPNLPNLHINEGALGLMFGIYKKVLPTCGDYIQDGGNVNMANMQLILNELAQTVEKDAFEAEVIDSIYLGGKQQKADFEEMHRLEKKHKKKKELVLTPTQRDLFDKLKTFVLAHTPGKSEVFHFDPSLKPVDRKFVETVARDLGMGSAIEYSNEDDTKHIYVEFESDDEEDTDEYEEDEEALAARDRVLNKYDNAPVVAELSNEEIEQEEKDRADQQFKKWRADYYMEKMDIDIDNEQQMDGLIGSYITGIQWVLHYYYDGVVSWGWFYPYHYAPKISDLVNISKYQDTKFDLGQPFKPYEQLMGVLPALSKKLLPAAYQELMTDPSSPIIEFYPRDFELDMNGKKQDWEAVVKIPFIDEAKLLEAMKRKEGQLTKMERDMARFGESFKFVHAAPVVNEDDDDAKYVYKSPLPNLFPDIHHCTAREVVYHLPTLGGQVVLRKSLLEGAKSGKDSLAGFPTLATIPYTSALSFHNVKVFQQDSKNETVVVKLQDRFANMKTEDIAKLLLYKRVYVHYPYLQEAVVVAVSNEMTKYTMKISGKKRIIREVPLDEEGHKDWEKRTGRAEYLSSKRFGLEIGATTTALHVCVLRGMKRTDDGALIKEYVSPMQEEVVPVQAAVMKVAHEDSRYIERKAPPVSVGYPISSNIFLLGGGARYGTMGTITGHSDKNTLDIQMVIPALSPRDLAEPTFGAEARAHQDQVSQYISSFVLAERIKYSALTLSKISSSLQIMDRNGQRVNVGLNLKFEARQLKVIGYTRKNGMGHWEYSAKAADLIKSFVGAFPNFIQLVQGSKNGGFGSEMINANDFAWAENGSAEIKRMKHWLKERGVDDLPKAPLSAEEFEEPVVKAMESVAAQYHAYYEGLDFKRVLVKNTPRTVLLRPEDAEVKLHAQVFQLGDRVTYVLETGSVPIDSKGTVVGVQEKAVEVVFDTPFMGGQDLAGRCSEYRGMVLPFYAVLNTTVPQLNYEAASSHQQGTNIKKDQQQPKQHQKQHRGPDGQQQSRQQRGDGQQQPRRIMKKPNGVSGNRD